MRGRVLVVLGLSLAVAGSGLMGAAVRQSLRAVPVPVATRDLPAFVRIEARDIRLEDRPAAGVHPRTVMDPGRLIGRLTLAPVSAGEPILDLRLSEGGAGSPTALRLQDGWLGFAVPVTAGAAWGQTVQDGDRVDVIWSVAESRDMEAFAVVIMDNVPVVGTVRQEGTPLRGSETSAVILGVDSLSAARLALALGTGRIHLALRGPADSSSAGRGPVTVRDLLMGEQFDSDFGGDGQWAPAQ